MTESADILKFPPPMHPNAVDAVVYENRNTGIHYWPGLNGPVSVSEWAMRQKRRWVDAERAALLSTPPQPPEH